LELSDPPEDSQIEVTFNLDINGILNVSAMETTTKKVVKAEFKSSRGYKAKKSALDEEVLLSMNQAGQTLVTRAEKALETLLNNEDKKELESIIEKYKTAHSTGDQEAVTKMESELLDLLYYLENEN
jgi:molecular chaperone DnaK